jgi:hypothetical protein
MKNKIIGVGGYTLSVIIMIVLIPLIKNDYLLALVYLLVSIVALTVKRERNDLLFLVFGFLAMTFFEIFFVSTGVEIFVRQSLFGLMPVWLPFLWAYGFVAIKRSIKILEK